MTDNILSPKCKINKHFCAEEEFGMKLNELLSKQDITLSFEVFPPKVTANYEAVKEAAYSVAKLVLCKERITLRRKVEVPT